MAIRVRRVDYYNTTVRDQPGEAYKLLAQLAASGVSLLAFTAVPVGPDRAQLTIFPEDDGALTHAGKGAGISLDGPHPALLVRGDDELGALAGIHEKLFQAGVNVYAASGVSDGTGTFGYLIYVRPDEFEQAATALEV
ncbi:MAG: hypothetical protein U0610_18520 [bacterium]